MNFFWRDFGRFGRGQREGRDFPCQERVEQDAPGQPDAGKE